MKTVCVECLFAVFAGSTAIGVRAATRDSENGYNPPAWQAKVRDIRKIADSQEIST